MTEPGERSPLPALDALEAHPYADMFPMIDEADRASFRADIKANGLTDPVVLLDGKILDGRNRYRELKVLGWHTDPRHFITWAELVASRDMNPDPFAFAVGRNLHRRHLTEGQRAMSAARVANMRQGERNDIAALPFDGQPSANVRKVSQGEAATMFKVSERLVSAANVVMRSGIDSLRELTDAGKVTVSVAEGIARMPVADQERAIATHKPEALKTVAKKFDRERRAAELAQKQAALPIKKYGVIYADPEWDFVVRSEGGLDRAAANHYPTSPLDQIMARRVGDIAADDCVLFMWATVPMLLEAFMVAHAWGFVALGFDPVTGHMTVDKRRSRYVSNWDWVKTTIAHGYWGRNQHEHLLIFTRGNPIAPAPGTQPASAIHAPVMVGFDDPWKSHVELTDAAGLTYATGEHSQKPGKFAEWIERLFPDAPKIELNAREARPGWDVWGNEAPVTLDDRTPAERKLSAELRAFAEDGFDQLKDSVPDADGNPVRAGGHVNAAIGDPERSGTYAVRRVYKNGNVSIDDELGHQVVLKARQFTAASAAEIAAMLPPPVKSTRAEIDARRQARREARGQA